MSYAAEANYELCELAKLIDIPMPIKCKAHQIIERDAEEGEMGGMGISEFVDMCLDLARI